MTNFNFELIWDLAGSSNMAFADQAPPALPAMPATQNNAQISGGNQTNSQSMTQPAQNYAAPPQKPSTWETMLPLALMFGVLYFVMIRPQQKKVKEQQGLLTALKQGDEVVTSSGIIGTIAGMTEKVVTLEIADRVKIKLLKSQINQIIKGQIKELN